MKISMDLSVKSIMAAAEKLRAYARKLEEGTGRIEERLSEVAADEARTHFDGDVSVEALPNGVRASGESVVFQEFGAGARISDPFPGGADVGFEIRRGAYSDLHGGEYAQSGYESWHYRGEEYRYVTPRNGLFYGMMKAKEESANIVREVLEAHDQH